MAFFGLKSDATVVEIWPSAGWYTEILAPYLKDKGHLIAAVRDDKGEKEFKEKFASKPDVFGNITVSKLNPPKDFEIAPAGSADFVLTFRNVHNWMKAGEADKVFAAFNKALKPGGYLGIEEHRGNPSVKQDPKAESGYVNEDYLINMAKKAGFTIVGKSEINANPKDDKNHPKGVWTLPPVLRLGDKDKAKYMEIGESDRMTLLFKKT